jgi:small subunit ribosomal protein S16
MPVKIRLTRMGKKKQPSYRVVVIDSRKPRDGAYIEQIGFYDPRQEPSTVEIDNEAALKWLRNGAQPTERARKLLEISGAWTQFKVAKGEIHVATPTPALEPEIHVVEAPAEVVDEAVSTDVDAADSDESVTSAEAAVEVATDGESADESADEGADGGADEGVASTEAAAEAPSADEAADEVTETEEEV